MAVIAGPYEFSADKYYTEWAVNGKPGDGKSSPPAEEAVRTLKAHTLLNIDAGWISPVSARWLKEKAGKNPPGYHEVNADPLTRILSTSVGKIGLVFFPQGPVPGRAPTAEQEKKVLAAGRSLQSRTVMVIGVSPWGAIGEKRFLPKAQGVFACILGGGEGVAFAQSLEQGPDLLWLRPDSQGRAVNVVELLELPKAGAHKWRENITFRASLEFLDASFPSDPAMRKLVGSPPTDE